MVQPNHQIERLAGALAATGGLKMWSVIVTVLGDISRDGEAEVSGLALSQIVERIGLQPQAMRVALHRLKRDGWIESRREGRVVYHRLTVDGLSRSRAVIDRIYGGPPTDAGPVYLAILPTSEARTMADLSDDIDAVVVAPRSLIVAGDVATFPEDWLVTPLAVAKLPDWVRLELEQAACDAEFRALGEELDRLPPDRISDPMARLALRLLVLHGWRRLVLRSEPLAEGVLGPSCGAMLCRAQVQRLLNTLSLPSKLEALL